MERRGAKGHRRPLGMPREEGLVSCFQTQIRTLLISARVCAVPVGAEASGGRPATATVLSSTKRGKWKGYKWAAAELGRHSRDEGQPPRKPSP